MKRVAIVGVGLIGGSFGLALRGGGFPGEIVGVSSRGAIEAALAVGAISRSATLEEACSECDLIYLAQPVDRILETLPKLRGKVRSDCLVTDAGSTKRAIVVRAAEMLAPGQFVGGHPIAGKEVRGATSSDANLFRNRPYVLIPDERRASGEEFRSWLSRIGAIAIEMTAAEHDRVLAYTSHLPQVLSTALALALSAEQTDQESIRQIFGSGLLDMTRLALSSAELWESIAATNGDFIESAIDSYLRHLGELKAAVRGRKLNALFEEANGFAKDLRKVSFVPSD